MVKVMFVCLGNICRSPMAEALFRRKVADLGLSDRFQIASRATSLWQEGKPPHEGTRRKLLSEGLTVQGLYSEPIKKADFNEFDVIIGMDDQNLQELKEMAPPEAQQKIHLLLEVLPTNLYREVPDPYYTGDFELTFKLIDEGTSKWLELLSDK